MRGKGVGRGRGDGVGLNKLYASLNKEINKLTRLK